MNLSPEDLARYQGDMQRSRKARGNCWDCAFSDSRICNRHAGLCLCCDSDDVVERVEWNEDGVYSWMCQACLDKEAETLRAAELTRELREEQKAAREDDVKDRLSDQAWFGI